MKTTKTSLHIFLFWSFVFFQTANANAQEFGINRLNPTIINGNVILCPGGTEVLETQEYDTYQWYKDGNPISGATQQTHLVSYYADAGSNISVFVTQGDQSAMSPSILVDGWVFSPLVVSSYGSGYWFNGNEWEMCPQHELFFEVMGPYTNNVQWFRDGVPIEGANSPVYSVDKSGIYAVHGSPSLCPDYVQYSIDLPVIVHTPPQPVISQSQDTLFTSHYPGQWYSGFMPLPGETGAFLVPASNGWYSFKYIDGNGCESTSDAFYFEWDPVGNSRLGTLPAPSVRTDGRGIVIVNAVEMHFNVFAVTGVKIAEGQIHSKNQSVELPLPGMYIVRLHDDDRMMTRKVVVE